MEYDEENIEIRKRLLNLPKFKASENFLNDLYYKINNLESKDIKVSKHSKEKAGFWEWVTGNVLTNRRNPWLAPAIGFTAVLLIVFSVVFIINRMNVPEKDKVTTEQSVTTETTQTPPPPVTSDETLKQDETEGEKVNEDFAYGEYSTKTAKERYTDQGKIKLETESQPVPEKKPDEVKQEVVKPEKMEIQATDKAETKGEEKGVNEKKAMKKADTEKKEGDIKTGKTEKEKREVTKSDKDKIDNKVTQGATEIDKNALKSLKEKIEESLKP